MFMRHDLESLRARAVELRAQGKSRMQIKEILGVTSNWTLNELLKGTVPADSVFRANAKDHLHARARELRAEGWTYPEIAKELGVSKASVSSWVRDLPKPERLSREESRRRNDEGRERYWAEERPRREAARQAIADAARAEVGRLSDREILLIGAVAYWCEGAKNKPHRRADHVLFVNSDTGLIRLFLRFLRVAGVDPADLTFRVLIHESADVEAAHEHWRLVTGFGEGQFRKPTLKRHNPKTARHNTGVDYHGCLAIYVRRSMWLYRKIEGWVAGQVDVGSVTESAAVVRAR